jgi:hypothetical protein
MASTQKSLESFLRLLQYLIIMDEYPLMILLLMMHAGVIIALFYPNVEYHVNEKELNVCHLYVCIFFRSSRIPRLIFREQTTMQTVPNINYKGSKRRRFQYILERGEGGSLAAQQSSGVLKCCDTDIFDFYLFMKHFS